MTKTTEKAGDNLPIPGRDELDEFLKIAFGPAISRTEQAVEDLLDIEVEGYEAETT